MCNNSNSNSWGGSREGAGRKRQYVKRFYFSATQEIADLLMDIPTSERTDFINDCIRKAAAKQ